MGQRFVRGALYVGAANWATYFVNFAIAILVARILGPEAFGLYAFVVAINEVVNIVNGLAIAPALVQAREESRELYDTGYAMSFAQGLVGLAVSLALIPFFSERGPEVAWFLVLLAIARFGVLLADIVMARLDRNVRYGHYHSCDRRRRLTALRPLGEYEETSFLFLYCSNEPLDLDAQNPSAPRDYLHELIAIYMDLDGDGRDILIELARELESPE